MILHSDLKIYDNQVSYESFQSNIDRKDAKACIESAQSTKSQIWANSIHLFSRFRL